MLIERAPAKINLTLHITGRRADGWHELESLVAFTRAGDTLSLEPSADLRLHVDGPTAGAAGDLADNLVVRATRHLEARIPGLRSGAFRLTKRLPVAAGIGGGSSDAAAALRLLARANGLLLEDARLREAAAATGADVPVCLDACARMMSGVGDKLGPRVPLPALPALVVNPGVPLDTKRVFARMDLAPGWENPLPARDAPAASAAPWSAADLVDWLRSCRNDMEDAAATLAPVVVDVLAVLAAAPGCDLARMSGSGATCFGLFKDCRSAGKAAKVIRAAHPGWYVKAAVLG